MASLAHRFELVCGSLLEGTPVDLLLFCPSEGYARQLLDGTFASLPEELRDRHRGAQARVRDEDEPLARLRWPAAKSVVWPMCPARAPYGLWHSQSGDPETIYNVLRKQPPVRFKLDTHEHDPWKAINRSRIAQAREVLSRRVIGQPKAVESVVRMLMNAHVGVGMTGGKRHTGPKGVFFFVGPTGVGKTELAKAVTEFVFGDQEAYRRFDMSEYHDEHDAQKLIGSPPGYEGHETGGQLTRHVIENPHSIILFDEIEKAHPTVMDKFLQILEDGRMTDGRGQTAHFDGSAVIFTSNIGASELYGRTRAGGDLTTEQVATFFREQVRQHFSTELRRPEIFGRLAENVVPFDVLRPKFVGEISRKFLALLAEGALAEQALTLEFEGSVEEVICTLMEHPDNVVLGGRRIKTLLESLVRDPLNEWLFENAKDGDQREANTLRLALDGSGKLVINAELHSAGAD